MNRTMINRSSTSSLPIRTLAQEVTFRAPEDGFAFDRTNFTIHPGTTERVEISWTPIKAMSATYCGQICFDVVVEAPVEMPAVEMKARVRGVATGGALRALDNGAEARSLVVGSATKRPRDSRLATRRSLVTSPRKLSSNVVVVCSEKDEIKLKQRRVDDKENAPSFASAPVARALQLQKKNEDVHTTATTTAEDADFQAGIWLRQQELAFIAWLNHTIVLDEAGTMGDDAPVGNRGGAATAREVRQTVRNKLTSLYSYDDELGRVLKKTYRHVDNARLRLNTGQSFMDDTALEEDFIRALSCYSPFWLQLGVDVVVGGGVVWKRHGGDLHAIQKDCVDVLRRDRDLEIEFGTGHYPGAPPYAHGYEEALSRNILKRVLLLVFILDRAATSGLPPNTPLLMRPHAALKKSEDVLRAALRGSMYGEGDLIRNLSQCSYKLRYEQNPIREYDFSCTNLAVDLRDGVRLCRLMEVLNSDVLFMSYDEKNKEWKRSLLSEAHFPCASRAHKIHNVEIAMRVIKDQQVGLPGTWSRIKAEDIVDGHLEHTMGLLWALMMHYSAPGLLLPKSLDAEIERLGGRVPDVKRIERLAAAKRGDSVVESPQCAMEARLFTWAKAACATQKVELNNLGSAFTDGRVLCALIRAYAPMMIPKRRIGSAPLKLNDADPETAKSALTIARDNFAVASKALQALGGVPNPTFDIRLSASGDDVESPDPRAVSGYLLFLSARLLLLRQQEVACIRVQRWWRWHRPNRPRFAVVAQRWISATTVIASHVRRAQAVKSARARLDAIVKVQAFRRGRSERVEFMKKRDAAVKIQAFYRMRMARLQFEDAKWAVKKMQKIRKGSVQRKRFQEQRRAASLIQGWYRTVVARNEYLGKAIAVTVIQAHWRGFVARKRAKQIVERRNAVFHDAACKIQAAVRKCLVRKQFLRLRWAVTLAQARARSATMRRTFVNTRKATVKIQQNVRRFLCFKAYQRRSQMIQEEKRRAAAVVIQRHFRGHTSREREFTRRVEDAFATTIQAFWRGYVARKAVKRLRLVKERRTAALEQASIYNAAETIQRHVRGLLCRRNFARKRECAVAIQSHWRMYNERLNFKLQRAASILIQRHARPLIESKMRAKKEKNIAVIQAYVRGWLVRKRSEPRVALIRRNIARTSASAEPRHSLRARAQKAASMISAPRTLKECVRGCAFFSEHWSLSPVCRDAATAPAVLHALMRNIRQCTRSSKQFVLITAAYDLLETIAGDDDYVDALAESRDCLVIIMEHMQMFRDRPSFVESAVNLILALSDNKRARRSMTKNNFGAKVESLCEVLSAKRMENRRRAMSFAQQGRYRDEEEAREELLNAERSLSALKRLTRSRRT